MKLHIVEYDKTLAKLDTDETKISETLLQRAIEEARYQCINPPLLLYLYDNTGERLAHFDKVNTERYWAGHEGGHPPEARTNLADLNGISLFAGFFCSILGLVLLIAWLFS